jgi:mRNA interferase RelE/StbE
VEVTYRQSFLKDLKNLRGTAVYARAYELAFEVLAALESSQEIPNIKALKGHPDRYRIRIGGYRVGIEMSGNSVELVRVLHRREFYRYFP